MTAAIFPVICALAWGAFLHVGILAIVFSGVYKKIRSPRLFDTVKSFQVCTIVGTIVCGVCLLADLIIMQSSGYSINIIDYLLEAAPSVVLCIFGMRAAADALTYSSSQTVRYFCTSCHTERRPESNFCTKCGNSNYYIR